MSHIEHLGTKSLYLAIDKADAILDDNGLAHFSVLNGSTETRISMPLQLLNDLPNGPIYATLEGDALLHISVDDDCSLSGYEVLNATAIKALNRTPGIPARDVDAIAIPY